jgi:hypothetical protein
MVGMAAAVLFLVGYARNVWWLYEVRPWRGLHNFTEASVTVYRPRPDGNATAKTMRVEPFFPPAFDLEPDCKMIARFPSWFVALPVLIVLVGGARTIYYELDGEAV